MNFIIQRKTFVSMLFLGLALTGYVSYRNLPVELYPNAELPVLIVQINSQLEVDPGYMENQGVIPIEGAIGKLEGIDEIVSFANTRRGTVYINYAQSIEIKYAYLKLLEGIATVLPTLPEEFQVNVIKVDSEQLANQFMSVEVRGSGGVDRLRQIADLEIAPAFENVDGLANAEVFGGREKSVEIIIDEKATEAHGLTLAGIRNIIRQNNQRRAFVGAVSTGNQRHLVNVTAEYTELRDLENLILVDDGPIFLRDVADISIGVKEETSISRVNGKEAVTIQLVRDTQVNLIDLAHETMALIDRLNADLAYQDIEISVQNNAAEVIESNIDMITELALIGGGLAIVILWFFLGNIRIVVTIALAIPISVLTAFNFFYAFDITINSLTLIGMALAIGMLLDNSVVVLENIYRLGAAGKDRLTSVTQGTIEVRRSILAATLTTITVFLPFLFSSNYMIELIGHHVGVSIISTLAVSLLVALLLIPMMSHAAMPRNKAQDMPFQVISLRSRLIQIYVALLKACLRFPARTIIAAVVVFFASVFMSLSLSLNVSTEVDLPDFNLYLTMPSGATLESTDKVTLELEDRLAGIEETEDLTSQVYEETAILTISLLEDYESVKGRSIDQIKADIQERIDNFSGADVSFDQPQSSQQFQGGGRGGGGGGASPLASFERLLGVGAQTESIVIKGRDFSTMRNVADDIQYYLEELTSIQTVSLNVSDNRPEVHLTFDHATMSQHDIALNAVSSELNSFQSEFSAGVSFKQGVEEYDIVIRTQEGKRQPDKRIDELRILNIPAPSGAAFELQELSRIVFAQGMAGINRVNQEKQITVTYRFLSEINDSKSLLESARAEIDEVLAALTLPSGIAVEKVNETSELDEFYFLIAAAAFLIYMILASVFESFSTPVVLMFSIPLAAIGSLVALILTGNSLLNANTLVGFLILLGVVVNNGIILIDYCRILQRGGFRRSRALISAGLARVRPILITAITTIVALMPLALGQAEYVGAIGSAFAITVIGGLALSTLFTLIFIPTLYSGLENAMTWMRSLDWRIKYAQATLFVLSCWLITVYVDDLIWQFVYLFGVILTIPSLAYFILSSLRQAKATLIAPNEAIAIKIRNVAKIYDHESRFMREWHKGKRQKARNGSADERSEKTLNPLFWQLPLLGFLFYFTYFYLEKPFWLLFLSVVIYLFSRFLLRTIAAPDRVSAIFYWGFPLANLVLFQIRWGNPAAVIFVGLLWYGLLFQSSVDPRDPEAASNGSDPLGRLARWRTRIMDWVGLASLQRFKKRPFRALDGVSLEIGRGMFGLLGPNGAGKTTIMRIICGILEESYGTVSINEFNTKHNREELQGLIGYLPQEFGMYENLTAFEFLNYQAILKGLVDQATREQRIADVLRAVHMEDHADENIGSFSGGMKQRIGIAQILLHLPRILVVDEPTAGLDPRERIRFRNLLVELSRDRIVIFSTHIIEDISSSCNRVAVLNRGKLHYLGEPEKMSQMAEGHVWQFKATHDEFTRLQRELLVVHHSVDGDRIRVRCLADEKPVPAAQAVKASLEDAYLWLQRGGKAIVAPGRA